MRRIVALFSVTAFLLLPLAACILDPKPTPVDTGGGQDRIFEDLTEKSHVLNNLALAYTERNLFEYKRLLDNTVADAFLFFFADADVNDTTDPAPESWGWADETRATGHLFDRAYEGDTDPVTRIELTIQAAPTWTEVTPEDPRFPDETWHLNVVRYNLFVQTAGPTDYQSLNLQAEFTIRQIEVDDHMEWRIVRWRDDIDPD